MPPRADDQEPVDPDVDLAVPDQRRELAAPRGGPVLGAIAIGGVVGAEARYGLGLVWPHASTAFPWATLVINASGCLLIGVLMVLITERFRAHPLVRPLLGVGVLGGYTTFSTFAVDVLVLGAAGHPVTAAAYLVATPLAALVAVRLGAGLARGAVRRPAAERRGTA